jgi:flagellar biogenesis protein FliO
VYASLAASLLLLSAPGDLPSRTPADPAPAPAAPLPAPAAAAAPAPAAPSLSATPELRLPRSGLEPSALAAPVVLLAGLAAATWLLRRRRRPAGRRVEVLETTSLGPKRSLVLARFEDELLLLGTSEAGVQLLHRRTGPGEAAAEAVEALREAAPPAAPASEPPGAGVLSGLVTRLRRARPETASAPRFDALLAESAEDQELRRKLARGQGGSVR